MFHKGDMLAHPSHGGCIISDICTRQREGCPVEYLVLHPQNNPGLKVMVPVESVEKVGLRALISEEDADQLLDSFAQDNRAAVYENDFAKRRKAYQEILKSGTLPALVALIQELMRRTKLNSGDQEMLPKAQRKLFSEISMAKGMEFQRVLDIASSRMLLADQSTS